MGLGCLQVFSIAYRVRISVDLCPGVKGEHMFAINVYLHIVKCEHFKLTKGDSDKMVLV